MAISASGSAGSGGGRLVVGAPQATFGDGRTQAGAAYMFLGSADRTFPLVDQVFGKSASDQLGTAVAGGKIRRRRRHDWRSGRGRPLRDRRHGRLGGGLRALRDVRRRPTLRPGAGRKRRVDSSGVMNRLAFPIALALAAATLGCATPRLRPDGGKGLLPVGAVAPDVEGQTLDDRTVRLGDVRGCPAVVYFYPRDGTPGCTKEACAFRDSWSRFRQAGVTIFGVSNQSRRRHREFAAEHQLVFPLVADESRARRARLRRPRRAARVRRGAGLVPHRSRRPGGAHLAGRRPGAARRRGAGRRHRADGRRRPARALHEVLTWRRRGPSWFAAGHRRPGGLRSCFDPSMGIS